jgi:hypothetical protein
MVNLPFRINYVKRICRLSVTANNQLQKQILLTPTNNIVRVCLTHSQKKSHASPNAIQHSSQLSMDFLLFAFRDTQIGISLIDITRAVHHTGYRSIQGRRRPMIHLDNGCFRTIYGEIMKGGAREA